MNQYKQKDPDLGIHKTSRNEASLCEARKNGPVLKKFLLREKEVRSTTIMGETRGNY